jgi:tuberous sclerosis 2
MELNSNKIFVRAKDDITSFVCHSEPKIVSDSSAPLLARQLALHANVNKNSHRCVAMQFHLSL